MRLIIGLTLAVAVVLSAAICTAALLNDDTAQLPYSVDNLALDAPLFSSVVSKMVYPSGIPGGTVEVWPSGYTFHPRYTGFVFSSIEIPAGQHEVSSSGYLSELCRNLNSRVLELDGISTPINASVVSLFNYYDNNFYKGIYIAVENGIFIFPALSEEGAVRLMVGFSVARPGGAERVRENVGSILSGNIQNIVDFVSSALPDPVEPTLEGAVRQYYTRLQAVLAGLGTTYSDRQREIRIRTELVSLSEIVSEYNLNLQELCGFSSDIPDIEVIFSRFLPHHAVIFAFRSLMDFSALQDIDLSMGISYGILKVLGSIQIQLSDNNNRKAIFTIDRDSLIIQQPDDSDISPVLAQIILDQAGSEIAALNSDQSLRPEQRIERIIEYLSRLDIAAIVRDDYAWAAGAVDTDFLSPEDILAVISVYDDSISDEENRGRLYFKISQEDIDKTMLKISLAEPLNFSEFEQSSGFDRNQVKSLSIQFNSLGSSAVSGSVAIDSFNFSLQADSLRDIRLYQYKSEVAELFMRFCAHFNPLTDPKDDALLTEMVLPALRGEETYLQMMARVWGRIGNIIFLSPRIGQVHNLPYDMNRVIGFERSLLERLGHYSAAASNAEFERWLIQERIWDKVLFCTNPEDLDRLRLQTWGR